MLHCMSLERALRIQPSMWCRKSSRPSASQKLWAPPAGHIIALFKAMRGLTHTIPALTVSTTAVLPQSVTECAGSAVKLTETARSPFEGLLLQLTGSLEQAEEALVGLQRVPLC